MTLYTKDHMLPYSTFICCGGKCVIIHPTYQPKYLDQITLYHAYESKLIILTSSDVHPSSVKTTRPHSAITFPFPQFRHGETHLHLPHYLLFILIDAFV